MSKLVAGKCSYSNAVVSKGLLIAVAKTVEGVTSYHGIMAMSLGINVILKTRLDGDRLNMMKRIQIKQSLDLYLFHIV